MASGLSAIQSVSALTSAYSESESLKAQGAYAKQTADANAHLSMLKAQDTKERGALAQNQQLSKVDQMVSSQRAAQAANGVDINSGSAASVRSSSRMMGELDALTIKNNAWREAWGYQVEADNQRQQGEFSNITARSQAANTLLTGGLKGLGYGAAALEKVPTKDSTSDTGASGVFRQRRNGDAWD